MPSRFTIMSRPAILVTGAAGFIGSHLLEALLAAGEPVVALDNLDGYYDPAIKRANLRAADPGGRAPFFECDLNDAAALDRLFAAHPIDRVAHLAGRGGVRPSVRDPLGYVRINLDATINLCAAMRRHGVARIAFASTSSVYGEAPVPWRESMPADRPVSPYAATKRAAELYLHTEARLNGTGVTVLRFFTVYGPRQRPDMALAKFAEQALGGGAISRFGDGEQLRDFTEVSDIVAGFRAALGQLSGAPAGQYEICNLGSGRPRTVNEMIAVLQAHFDRPLAIEALPAQAGDAPATYADLVHSAEFLGFAPAMTLETGIPRYLAWRRAQQ